MATVEEQALAIVREEAEAIRAHIAEYQKNLARIDALADVGPATKSARRTSERTTLEGLADMAGARAGFKIKKLLVGLIDEQ